jgi:integrase
MIQRTGSIAWDNRPRALTTFTLPSRPFSASQSNALANPFDAIDKVPVPAKPPGILSPEECQNLLNAAGDDILPLVSIQAFCGVRSAETLRLNWSDVDSARGFVQIAAEQAKGARRSSRKKKISKSRSSWT